MNLTIVDRLSNNLEELDTDVVGVPLDLLEVLSLGKAAKSQAVEQLANQAAFGKPRHAETEKSRRKVMTAILELDRPEWSWPEQQDSRLKIIQTELGHVGVTAAMFPVTVYLPEADLPPLVLAQVT